METIVRRHIYLDHIISLLNREMMLVLVGQRRIGKSYLLLDLCKWLGENRPGAKVLFLDKEQKLGNSLMNSDQLYALAKEEFEGYEDCYLLIDEVQNIEDYDVALRNLYAERICQIVVTGSNAYIYSQELGTRLGGRYIEIPVYTLTYPEFLEFHRLIDSDESLMLYIRNGGLPGLSKFDLADRRTVRDYIQGVYNTVMMKDVMERTKIRNAPLLANLATYLADTSGKLVSPNSIAGTLISQGIKVTGSIIGDYIDHIKKGLLVNPVWRYDIHGKKFFEQNFKYYFADHGIRNFLTGFKIRESIERIMENVVYNHLMTHGFEVCVGMLPSGEIDFVADRDEERIYFQVAYSLGSDDTIKREFGNLKKIRDSYPKYVISMDPICGEVDGYPGINHIHLRTFLTNAW